MLTVGTVRDAAGNDLSWFGHVGAGLSHGWDTGIGALEGAGNVALNVLLPQDHTPGDLFEPSNPVRAAAAAAATRLAQHMHVLGTRVPTSWNTAATQALLGAAQLTATAGADSHVSFSATAAGDSWGDAARSASAVSVFVDGQYHSSVAVTGERTEPYDVNLGLLAAGPHTVEVRSTPAIAAAQAAVASVSAVRAYLTTGQQALIDANEPIFQTRDDGNRKGAFSLTGNDAPLVVAPVVQPLSGGQIEIEYRVLLSDEDFGTTRAGRDRTYGRSTDYEALYDVVVNADGTPVSRWYESPEHIERDFDGSSAFGRPVIRLSTGNNNSSQWADGSAPMWSESAAPPTPALLSSTQLMLQHPWTFAVMQGEVDREHATPATLDQVDSRRFIYIGALPDAERAAVNATGSMTVRLTDGTTRTLPLGRASSRGDQPTTVALPAGVSSSQIAGVVGLPADSQVFVLDQADHPVMLAAV